MKKIFLSLGFFLTFLFLSSNAIFAQEDLSIKEGAITPTLPEIKKIVDYQLPYPGLLPDNPLYFAKAIRDAVVDFLISSPLKKADFYLLQADKRLNAGVYLVKLGESKYNLAQSTISKGQNYFEKAISKAEEAKRQGMDIKDLARRLSDSSKKHQEVLKSLEKMSAKDFKESLVSLEKRETSFEKQVKSLIAK